MPANKFPLAVLLSRPLYWPLALFLALFFPIVFLPLKIQLLIGRILGRVLFCCSGKLRHITQVNIEYCFPELESEKQRELQKASFIELGQSIIETFFVWFRSVALVLKERFEIVGEAHLQRALSQDAGVIMLSCHSGSLDMNVALFNQIKRKNKRFIFTYRPPSNKHLDNFLCACRKDFADDFFPVNNLFGITRALKQGALVWYAPDIETSKKGRVFVKFMNVEAATPSAIGKLAQSSGAKILPYAHERLDSSRYRLRFYPMLENFPTGEVLEDTQTVNHVIEKIIRANPATYWWSIKRFRYRSDGGPSIYSR